MSGQISTTVRPRFAALLLAGVAVILSACAESAVRTPTGPTLGSDVAGQADEASVDVELVNDELTPWTTEAPGGAMLSSRALAVEIREVVEDAHGKTSDVALEMRRFAPFPDLPAVERANIVELRADVRDLEDSTGITVTAEVAFTVDGTVDDLLELFSDDFLTRGWVMSDDRTGSSSGDRLRELTFAIPESAFSLDDVDLALVVASSLDGVPRTLVRMRYVEVLPGDDPIADRYVGWADDVPLPASPVIIGAGIHTSSVGRNTLHYSMATHYDEVTPEAIAVAVREALPVAGYSERRTPLTGDATDNWVHLNNDLFDKSWVSTQSADPVPSAANPTKVNVDARVDFSPEI